MDAKLVGRTRGSPIIAMWLIMSASGRPLNFPPIDPSIYTKPAHINNITRIFLPLPHPQLLSHYEYIQLIPSPVNVAPEQEIGGRICYTKACSRESPPDGCCLGSGCRKDHIGHVTLTHEPRVENKIFQNGSKTPKAS